MPRGRCDLTPAGQHPVGAVEHVRELIKENARQEPDIALGEDDDHGRRQRDEHRREGDLVGSHARVAQQIDEHRGHWAAHVHVPEQVLFLYGLAVNLGDAHGGHTTPNVRVFADAATRVGRSRKGCRYHYCRCLGIPRRGLPRVVGRSRSSDLAAIPRKIRRGRRGLRQ